MSKLTYRMELINDSVKSITGLDYLVLASGSDNRAYEILSKADIGQEDGATAVIFNFKERLEGKDTNDPLFDYRNLGIKKLKEIECEIKNPSSSLEQFEAVGLTKTSNIGVDISCFTKPYFYYLFKYLKEKVGTTKISAYYTEPKSYIFPKGLFSSFHSNTGPLSIIGIPGYTGQERRGTRRKLVILMGFDGDLSKEINEDVSPNETIVVNGFPSYTLKFKDVSLIANEKLVSDHNIEVQYARANNPFEVYNLLESIVSEEGQATFINVAPLGTKPMALGACLFALHNPTVRVVYPLPEMYEDKYSESRWNSWCYELPLTL